jgi:hypothetical protein
VGDQRQLAATLLSTAKVRQRQGDTEAAMDCLECSRVVFRKLGDQRGEARALDDLGTILFSKGDSAAGAAAWRQAHAILDKLSSPEAAAGVAARLAAAGASSEEVPGTT